jgi:glycosyltransferase involved in cell wall biosynthesis
MGRMANCYAGFLQHRLPQTAVIATMRTGKPLPFLFRRSLFRCRHVVANSLEARRVLIDLYGLPPEKITVIRNPLLRSPTTVGERNYELRRQHGAEARTLVLLNVAMFRREKNQRELVEICARLPGYLDWQLWLAGDGPSRASCERVAVDLGLASRVRFLGYQTDPTPLYLAADVAVLASQSESLSNFLIEAQLHGLPAVAYDVVGVGECFVPDGSGFLVANRDQNAFADRLTRLLREPALRRRFTVAAREHARREFMPEHQVRAHLDLFVKILARSV